MTYRAQNMCGFQDALASECFYSSRMFSTRWETNVLFTTAILLFTCIGAYSVLLNVACTASVLRWLCSHPCPVDISNAFGRPTTYHKKTRDYSLLVLFFPSEATGKRRISIFRWTGRFTIFYRRQRIARAGRRVRAI